MLDFCFIIIAAVIILPMCNFHPELHLSLKNAHNKVRKAHTGIGKILRHRMNLKGLVAFEVLNFCSAF